MAKTKKRAKAGWTPGPWRLVDERRLKDRQFAFKGADDMWIATATFYLCTPYESNARLIAQAPAMAEALEKLVEEYRSLWIGEGGGADACEHILAPYRALLTAIKGE